MGLNTYYLTAGELRRRLLRRREELSSRATRIRADKFRENDPLSPNFADQVTQRENDTVLDAIGESAGRELGLIDVALRRLDAGTYAFCSRCGGIIENARLSAVPYTDRCFDCAG